MHDYECDNDEIIQAYTKQFESKDDRICPHEDIIEVIKIGSEEEKKELKIVDNPEKEQMVELFREFIDVFAWSYQDMPGLDPKIASHKIPLFPDIKPKKQKLRRLTSDMSLVVRDEVMKQLEAGFNF